jgi:Fe2+ transport system protein FeoA
MNPSKPGPVKRPTVPLSAVEAGQDVLLVEVRAGRGLAQRLAEMGLLPNVDVRVLSNDTFGPVVVLVKGSRLVLGRGVAQKIWVD